MISFHEPIELPVLGTVMVKAEVVEFGANELGLMLTWVEALAGDAMPTTKSADATSETIDKKNCLIRMGGKVSGAQCA